LLGNKQFIDKKDDINLLIMLTPKVNKG